MKYIGIIGSRKRHERKAISFIINHYKEKYDITVVSGGAEGIDDDAEVEAKQSNVSIIIYRPNRAEYSIKGNGIYFERNKLIAEKVGLLFAFPLDRKGGTMNTIKHFTDIHGKDTDKLTIID